MDLTTEDPLHPSSIKDYPLSQEKLAGDVAALGNNQNTIFLKGMYSECVREATGDMKRGRKQLSNILFDASYSLASGINAIKSE